MASSSSSSSPTVFKLVVICMAMIAVLPLVAQSAITCKTVSASLDKCMPYVRNGGGVPKECCDGIKSLPAKAKTTSDRRMICKCLKDLAASLYRLQPLRLANLPNKCGAEYPYYNSITTTNCNRIK